MAADRSLKPREPLAEKARPTKTVRDVGSLDFAGRKIDYGYMPAAHTDGDLFVHFRELNVLAAGGVVSGERWPLLDYRDGAWLGGRVRAVEWLMEVAHGHNVAYPTRAPRFLATIPAVVHGPMPPTYMITFSVSENGCGLVWTGAVPTVGGPLAVRLGVATQAAIFTSVVCWTGRSGHAATVGVRFIDGARNAWAMMLTDVKRSGAPFA
jgi:hypothetical protein